MDKKRVIASTLIAALAMPTAAFAAKPTDFADFPNDWSTVALEHALDNDLLVGIDGKIEPQGTLTRAQMATVMSRGFAAKDMADISAFQDVSKDAWYYTEIARAVQMGALKGSGSHSMRPDDNITREEAFSVLTRLFALDDGNPSTLNRFSDAADVSDWAKTSVAAMIQSGYVHGDDQNRINPKGNITRAEFAAVMDNLVTRYVDGNGSIPSHVHGNVVVRADGLNLSGKTIDGDLIIADGVNRITLSNTTVNGRILVRGAEHVNLDTVTAENVLVDNPSETVNLDIQKSSVKKVTVKSSVNLSGEVQKVEVNGNHIRVTGTAKIDELVANGTNIKVTIPGTKVTAGLNSSVIMAGNITVAPGSSAVVPGGEAKPEQKPHKPGPNRPDKPEVKPDNPGVNPDKPGGGEEQQAQLVEKARVVDLGWSQFVTAQLTDGNTIENCKFTVDGVDISSAVTPVTDDGSVVKWEVSYWEHGSLTVTNGDQKQELKLNGDTKRPVVVKDQMPDYFLLNGPVYVWDYHLTNYDDAGNVRVTPKQTTISVGKQKDQIAYYSPDTILTEDKDAPHGVKGEVELMFNYADGTKAEKDFVDGITDVDLVSYNENKNTLNDKLEYTLNKSMQHGDHTVACIKVPVGQENFYSNGRYYLRVTSNGQAKLFPIHLVNGVVPTMELTGNTGENGTNVQFRVKNMTYAITSPVYRVDLTNPDQQTVTLTKFDDWFLNNDLLTVYNDKTNHFQKTGNYTITVYADGFQPFSKTFHQNAIQGSADQNVNRAVPASKSSRAKTMSVDAISTASVGGGSSEGGDGAGDTNVMNANLILDSDLLVNAELVKELGIESAAAEGIASRYESMRALYVFNEGAKDVYTYESYLDAVNTARTQGRYLTFDEYLASGKAETTLNRPASVKNVLEDNLLGQTINFRDASGIDAPALTLKESNKQQAVFSCSDEMFLRKLADGGELFLNKDYPALSRDSYTVDSEAGTLTVRGVKVGENKLKIVVPEYKVQEIKFNVEKVLEEVTLSAPENLQAGKELVITCGDSAHACDLMKHVKSVEIVSGDTVIDTVSPEGVESFEKGLGYTVKDNTLTIGKDVFLQSAFKDKGGDFKEGTYQINLIADFYGTKSVQVKVTAPQKIVDPEEVKEAPTVKKVNKGMLQGYEFHWDDIDYVNAVTGINLNGKDYTEGLAYGANGEVITLKEVDAYNKGTDPNTMIIHAEGYQDATVTFYIDAQGQISLKAPVVLMKAPDYSVETDPAQTKQIIVLSGEDKDLYWESVKKVTVNGTDITESVKNDGSGKLVVMNSSLNLGDNIVSVEATGYETLTVTLQGQAAVPQGKEVPKVDKMLTSSFLGEESYIAVMVPNGSMTDEDVEAYVSAILKAEGNVVFVDDVALIDSYGGIGYRGYNSEDKYSNYEFDSLKMVSSGFKKDTVNTVTIKVEGYQDLTFKVKNGKLVTE